MAKKEVFLSAFLVAVIVSVSVLPQSVYIAHAQTGNSSFSAPAIEWQKGYGDDAETASNLIQTSDGGYAFMKSGWDYQQTFSPATIYKVDSSGKMEWNKTIPFLYATDIIQTSDGGYEISGHWSTYGTTYIFTPTLVKTDSQANIQWDENFTTAVPNFFNLTYTKVQTSDGGFAYAESASIIKTDSNNNVQWVRNVTYAAAGDINFSLGIHCLIETSDGALVGLGVGLAFLDVPRSGTIYLIKTEPFLPLQSPSQLPTPIQTPTPAPSSTFTPSPSVPEFPSWIALPITLIIASLAVAVVKSRKFNRVFRWEFC
jgi:hypothetical protein